MLSQIDPSLVFHTHHTIDLDGSSLSAARKRSLDVEGSSPVLAEKTSNLVVVVVVPLLHLEERWLQPKTRAAEWLVAAKDDDRYFDLLDPIHCRYSYQFEVVWPFPLNLIEVRQTV